MDKIKELLETGLKYMKAGKVQFSPNTTNSLVDEWIKDVESALTPPPKGPRGDR